MCMYPNKITTPSFTRHVAGTSIRKPNHTVIRHEGRGVRNRTIQSIHYVSPPTFFSTSLYSGKRAVVISFTKDDKTVLFKIMSVK